MELARSKVLERHETITATDVVLPALARRGMASWYSTPVHHMTSEVPSWALP